MRARSWLKVGQTKSWKTSRSGAFIWANTSGCKADADRQDAFRFQGSQPSQDMALFEAELHGMKASIQLRLAQHLALTPQLQQSIRLLQLSTLELNQQLERDDDPLAGHARVAADGAIHDSGGGADAAGGADGVEADSGSAPADSMGARADESEFPAPTLDWGNPRESRDDDEPAALAWAAAETSLHDHVRQQLTSTQASPRDRVLVCLLIEAVEEDGYLRT